MIIITWVYMDLKYVDSEGREIPISTDMTGLRLRVERPGAPDEYGPFPSRLRCDDEAVRIVNDRHHGSWFYVIFLALNEDGKEVDRRWTGRRYTTQEEASRNVAKCNENRGFPDRGMYLVDARLG